MVGLDLCLDCICVGVKSVGIVRLASSVLGEEEVFTGSLITSREAA